MTQERNLSRLGTRGEPIYGTAQEVREMRIFNGIYPLQLTTTGTASADDESGGEWFWDADATDDDNTGTVLKLNSTFGAGRYRRKLNGNVLRPEWFSYDGLDIGVSIQRAVDYAESFGNTKKPWYIELGAGPYPIQSGVTINHSGIGIGGRRAKGFEYYAPTIRLAGNIAGNMFEFLGTDHQNGRAFCDIHIGGDYYGPGTPGTYSVAGYVLYLQSFTDSVLRNVSITRIDGGAVYINQAVKADLSHVYIQACGNNTYPAVKTEYVSTARRVQGTRFASWKVEHCQTYNGAQVQLGAGSTNKFSDWVMEQSTALGFPGMMFDMAAGSSICDLVNCSFVCAKNAGDTQAAVILRGDGIKMIGGAVAGVHQTYPLEIAAGNGNKVIGTHFGDNGNGALTPVIHVASGVLNTQLKDLHMLRTAGILDDGTYTEIDAVRWETTYLPEPYLIKSTGLEVDIHDCRVDKHANFTCTGLIWVQGDRPRVVNNRLGSDPLAQATGHGIFVDTCDRAQINGNYIRGAGKHGIFISESSVESINDNIVYWCGQENNTIYDGICIFNTSVKTQTGTIVGNTVEGYCRDELRITDISGGITGAPSHASLQISSNLFRTGDVNNGQYGRGSGGGNNYENNSVKPYYGISTAQPAPFSVGSLANVRALGTPASADWNTVEARYHTTSGDGGGGTFDWNAASTDADDNGVTLLPTGHVGAGRWKRRVTQTAIPEMYGADSSGGTDATPKIAAAFLAGYHVEGRRGATYLIDGVLTIPANTTFRLNGSTLKMADSGAQIVLSSGSRLLDGSVDNNSTYFSGTEQGRIYAASVTNPVVEDVAINAQTDPGSGGPFSQIQFTDVDGGRISRSTVANARGELIVLNGCTDVHVTGNKTTNGWSGVATTFGIDGSLRTECSDCFVTQNEVTDPAGAGIVLAGLVGGGAWRNRIHSTTGTPAGPAIRAGHSGGFWSYECVVSENRVTGYQGSSGADPSAGTGVDASYLKTGWVSKNAITAKVGVRVSGGVQVDAVTIDKNEIAASTIGVTISGSNSHVNILDNDIACSGGTSTDRGVYYANAWGRIHGNRIETTAANGVFYGPASGLSGELRITENEITGAGTGGIGADSGSLWTGDIVIRGNTVRGSASSAGIYARCAGNFAVEDNDVKISGTASYAIIGTTNTTNTQSVIRGNKTAAATSALSGIWLWNCFAVLATGNTVLNTGTAGTYAINVTGTLGGAPTKVCAGHNQYHGFTSEAP